MQSETETTQSPPVVQGEVIPGSVSDDNQQQEQPPSSEPAIGMNKDFYRSLRAGKIDEVTRMLEDPEACLLDQLTPRGDTPLHVAARGGQVEMIELILTRRPSFLTKQNTGGQVALQIAADAGHLAAVKSIAEFARQAEMDDVFLKEDLYGQTPLHRAVWRKQRKVARYLIDACPEASYICLDVWSQSPLFVAAGNGELELVRAMIEVPVKVEVQSALNKGRSVLWAAIKGGNLELLKAILSKHNFLIDSTLGPSGRNLALSFAASQGELQMVRHMLTLFPDRNYKIDKDGFFPIHAAAAGGHKTVVKEILQFHPDSWELLTSMGRNILHLAAAYGRDDVVRYILSKHDFDDLINAGDGRGNKPLHIAVIGKHARVVDTLTWDKRVDFNLVNADKLTAMDMCFQNPLPSLEEQMIWLALRYAGAEAEQTCQPEKTSENLILNNYKMQVSTLSLVATLVITMSFAAYFQIPGGTDDKNEGMATFLQRRIFQLFVISNSIALYTSVVVVITSIFALLADRKLLKLCLEFAIPLLAISLSMMSISFMSAAHLVVSKLLWLRITIWVLGSIFLTAVSTLFILLAPPIPTVMNKFIRYIFYLPFSLMLYFCEANMSLEKASGLHIWR